MIRKIDYEGRISLPVEFRRVLNLEPESTLDIQLKGDTIELTPVKAEDICPLCKEKTTEHDRYSSFHLCNRCTTRILTELEVIAGQNMDFDYDEPERE